jgi:hypothetical protein
MFEDGNPTAVSFLTLDGTWIINTSEAAEPVASSIIHS